MTLEELKLLKDPEIYKYIGIYKGFDSKKLALQLSKNKMLPARAIAEQVHCYQKAKKKLPSFIDKNLLFDRVALEQSSSEATARYKSTLISGSSIIDLTGGLGIDELFFATSFSKVVYCELNKVISKVFKFNITHLNIPNIEVNNTDSIKFLKNQKNNSFDWIFIDPSRRDTNRRSVDLEYCAPNVYENMNMFFEKSENIMIKAAPAYDLTEAVRRFSNLKEIHVVSVDGECKEVLLILNRNLISNRKVVESVQKTDHYINPRFQSGGKISKTKYSKRTSVHLDAFQGEVKIISVALNSKNDEKYILTNEFKNNVVRNESELKSYLYEPDCSIIKSNLAPLLSEKYNLSFINKLTPYLTNYDVIPDFPGRSFIIIDSIVFNEKIVKRYLKDKKIVKANISKRDFRLSVDEIRTKFKIKDGGKYYLFFTKTINKNSIMIVCKKVNDIT